MLCKLTSIAVVGALAVTTSYAQEQEYTAEGFGPVQGDWELILGGSGTNDEDFDAGSVDLNAEVGYYVTDDLELGLRQGVGYAENAAGDSASSMSTTGFADYHFDFGAVRPFIGVNIGALYGNAVEETFVAGPEVGAKWYVKDQTFIYGRAAYQFLFEDSDDADDALDDGRFVYVVGIGFNF